MNIIKTILLLTVLSISVYSQTFDRGKARGIFMSFAIGPRVPIREFSNAHSLGFGMNLEFSYTDNEYIPLFLYARAGYEHFPGADDFYRNSVYSSITTNSIPIHLGGRLFLPPVFEDLVLLIPIIELGGSYMFYERTHQFKSDAGLRNYLEDESKFGFHVGAGLSMFLIEIIGYYNYFPQNESLAADIKVRIPIFIKL